MYNKCDKCNKQLELYEERKLVMDSSGKIITLCMPCYDINNKWVLNSEN